MQFLHMLRYKYPLFGLECFFKSDYQPITFQLNCRKFCDSWNFFQFFSIGIMNVPCRTSANISVQIRAIRGDHTLSRP